MRKNYSSLLAKASFLAGILELQLFCTDKLSKNRQQHLAPNKNANGSQTNKTGQATGY